MSTKNKKIKLSSNIETETDIDFDEDENENFIEADPIEPSVFQDNDNNKFFLSYRTGDLEVNLYDCVKVNLESEEDQDSDTNSNYSDIEEQYGFGQVTAIFTDVNDMLYIEIRWFELPEDLPDIKNILRTAPKIANELVETEYVDIINAGAVCEIIKVSSEHRSIEKRKRFEIDDFFNSSYTVRYLRVSQLDHDKGGRFYNQISHSTDSKNFSYQKVNISSMNQRSNSYSKYNFAYTDQFEDEVDSNSVNISSSMAAFDEDFSRAIQKLHISVIPENLPCREKEMEFIYTHLLSIMKTNRLDNKDKFNYPKAFKPLYICGMPGTGKTATVLNCIRKLREKIRENEIDDFNFVEINCLRLKNPTDSYSHLWRAIQGQNLTSIQAQRKLRKFFSEREGEISSSTEKRPITICLMDELDYLVTKDFNVIYNFFDWPMNPQSRLIVIGITNTMDLLDRLPEKVNSRAGSEASRLIFIPYSHEQICLILKNRLESLDLHGFDNVFIEFVARKASSAAGDLRSALRICQNVFEQYKSYIKYEEKKFFSVLKKGEGNHDFYSSFFLKKDSFYNKNKSNIIYNIIKSSIDMYRLSPFIMIIKKLSNLDKAIILILIKYRKLVLGNDENFNIVYLTKGMIRDRLIDLIGKIKIIDTSSNLIHLNNTSNTKNISSSSINGSEKLIIETPRDDSDWEDEESEKNNENLLDLHKDDSDINFSDIHDRFYSNFSSNSSSSSSSRVRLYLPLPSIRSFELSLERLLLKGLLKRKIDHRKCGRPVFLYFLNQNFLYSDFIAAVSNTPWKNFAQID